MIGALATMAGYATQPKATFFIKHPVKAVRIARFRRNVRETITSRRFALGVAATLLAVPIGLWLGRKLG